MTLFKKQLINYLSKRNFKSQNAFTLVELIVVVVIIGILSSIAIPSFQNASEKAKQKDPWQLITNPTLLPFPIAPSRAAYIAFGSITGSL